MEFQKPKLVLHMDLNNTIIMKDDAQGYSFDFSVLFIQLKRILATQCWGFMEDGEWKIAVAEPCLERPNESMISYEIAREFADRATPFITESEEQDIERRKLWNNNQVKIYTSLIEQFILPGYPGEIFRPFYENMKYCLAVPKDLQRIYHFEAGYSNDEEINDEDMTRDEKEFIKNLFKNANYFLIPSFFRLLKLLEDSQRDFSIIFRTFGDDMEDVINEFNLFCNGKHPFHNGKNNTEKFILNGELGKRNLAINRNNIGCIKRNSESDCKVIIGSLNKSLSEQAFSDQNINVQVFDHSLNPHRVLFDKFNNSLSFAFVDDYSYWRKHQKDPKCGKLFLIDENNSSVHQIFFDDKIGKNSAGILDVRNIENGESLLFENVINKFIYRCDPYKAIIDPDYFYRAVVDCELNRIENK